MLATYVDHMGSDERVVDAARVSFAKVASNYTEDQNIRLISYLAKHGHFTPFTHPQVTIVEKVPIFVARQRFKHTVGFTYNEVSRRYVDEEAEIFTPNDWREASENKKQGSGDIFDEKKQAWLNRDYEWITKLVREFYGHFLAAGMAPEQARMILPQSTYTEYYVTGSLAAWARAYKLRIDPHAQKEIQELAIQWDTIIRPLFPQAWSALVD